MYLGPKEKLELKSQGILGGDERCLMCSEPAVILWNFDETVLLLCGEHAQYLGTHLLKDVRSFEVSTKKSVKVRTELK